MTANKGLQATAPAAFGAHRGASLSTPTRLSPPYPMGLLSFFKRSSDQATDAPAAAAPDAVAAARTRARRRLIGATVLLGIGVIGFPLLFETQPRPIPLNIPIEIPRKDGATPLLPPAAVPMAPAASAVVLDTPTVTPTVTPPVAAAPAPAEIVERAAEQGRETASSAATQRTAGSPPVVAIAPALPAVPAPKPAPPKAAPPKAAATADTGKPADDGNRARALLDGSTAAASSAANARVVVQVGAYADATKLVEARQKLEKLGLKTYTQVVEVDGNKRTRVRVGPFANRADADKTAARIKAAGLPAAILTL